MCLYMAILTQRIHMACTRTDAYVCSHSYTCKQIDMAQWLVDQGAKWPAILRRFDMHKSWSDELLDWARTAGCTSPTRAEIDDVDHEVDHDLNGEYSDTDN